MNEPVAPEDPVRNAIAELDCIADIMIKLGEDADQGDGRLPGNWMIWLGHCVLEVIESMVEVDTRK